MFKISKDHFVTKHLKLDSYKAESDKFQFNISKINKLNKPFFLSLKTNFSLRNKIKDFISYQYVCKQVIFEKKFEEIKKKDKNFCRPAIKSDLNQLKKICLEKTSNSHYIQDINLPKKFRNNFRYNWLKNFFKKKRGDQLIVYEKNKIKGFLLLIKIKKGIIIDLIATSEKYQKKGIGKSLLNYVNSFYMKKGKLLIAGTQSNNFSAVKFYSKMKFKKIATKKIYHLFGKKN